MRLIGSAVLLVLCLAGVATAEESTPWEFGLRGGKDAQYVNESFAAGEIYLLRNLPWQAETAAGRLLARLDLGVGLLDAAGDQGNWLAAGADLVWLPGDGTIEIEAGFRPAWLTDHYYGEDNFGGDTQFSSHVGIAVKLSRLVVNYRYQHLSNAGIYDNNDGIELHLLGAGFRF
jgi:hypothetical protein